MEATAIRKNTYVTNFFLNVQFGLALFFNAAYLASLGFSESALGIIFALAYAASLGILFLIPRLLRTFGNYRLFLFSSLILALISTLLALSPSSPAVAALFIAALVVMNIFLLTLLDIFLQAVLGEVGTIGARRGIFLTLTHSGLITAQLGAGLLLAWGGFAFLYGATAGLLLLIAAGVALSMRNFQEPVYETLDWVGVLFRLYYSPEMRQVFKINFILNLFFAVAAVYVPVYLYAHVGLSPAEMGIAFAIMFIPFLLLEIPLGRMEDSRGVKNVLVFGFVLLALSTAALAFIPTPALIVWAAALFATRVGAAMVLMGSDVYFFKHIDPSKTAEIAAFRALHPFAFVVGPFLGAILLLFMPLYALFIITGLAMLLGIPISRALTDTR